MLGSESIVIAYGINTCNFSKNFPYHAQLIKLEVWMEKTVDRRQCWHYVRSTSDIETLVAFSEKDTKKMEACGFCCIEFDCSPQ